MSASFPLVSAVICTKDRPVQLQSCLDTIGAQTVKVHEIIVVDASDRHQKQVENLCATMKKHGTLHYIRSSPGLTRQRNIGVLSATGTHCLFIDDDCELAPGAVDAFIETVKLLQNDTQLGAIGGKILEPFESASRLKIWLGRLIEFTLCRLFFLQRKGNGAYLPSGQPTFCKSSSGTYCQQIHGGFSFVSREIALSTPFDETLVGYAYMEDDDFAVRLTARGLHNYYQPQAEAVHRHTSTGRDSSYKTGAMFVRNWHYLFCKNFLGKQGNPFAFGVALAAQPVFSLVKGRPARAAGELSAGLIIVLNILKSTLLGAFRLVLKAIMDQSSARYWDLRCGDLRVTWGTLREEYGVIRYLCKWRKIATIVDVGYGTGRLQPIYSECGCTVTAIDISEAALGKSGDKACRRIIGSASAIPMKGRHFDLAVSISTLQHVPKQKLDSSLRDLAATARALLLKESFLYQNQRQRFEDILARENMVFAGKFNAGWGPLFLYVYSPESNNTQANGPRR